MAGLGQTIRLNSNISALFYYSYNNHGGLSTLQLNLGTWLETDTPSAAPEIADSHRIWFHE